MYILLAAYWGFLYYQHRQDILAVQNYITAILVFLVVEMLMTWGFYGTFDVLLSQDEGRYTNHIQTTRTATARMSDQR